MLDGKDEVVCDDGFDEFINGEWKISHYALTMLVPNSIAANVGALTLEAEK